MRSLFTSKMCKNFTFTVFTVLSVLLSFAQTTYNYTGALQTYTVPAGVTSIEVDVYGAQGGSGTIYGTSIGSGGLGARIRGEVSVVPGETLVILVGGAGGASGGPHGNENGGGGGSFVVRQTGNIPLVIAGGGGGAPSSTYGLSCARNILAAHGQTTSNGSSINCAFVANGGSGGNGGSTSTTTYCGGAGGGFYTDGLNGGTHCSPAFGGRSFLNGGAGGAGNSCYNTNNFGGYGGGGGGMLGGPGAGGGYSGGASAGNWSTFSTYGGGGGSYNIGTNQLNISGNKSGNGQIVITELSIPCNPLNQTVSPATQEICPNTSATIQIASSEVGVEYVLRDDSDDSVIDGPIMGTGGILTFNTGNISANTNYNVFGTGPSGGLDFDGIDDQVVVPNAASLNISGQITMEAWVKPELGNAVQNIICKSSSTQNTGYIIRTNDNWTSFATMMHIGGGWQVVSAPFPAVGQWHHIASTYDGTTIRLYLDGVEVNSQAVAGVITTNTNPLALGQQTGFVNEWYSGTMDEARVWNITRTPAEVLADVTNCLAGTEPGLVAYYQFEDGTGSPTLSDLTANANNGTLSLMDPATDWVDGVLNCSTCTTEMSPIAAVTMDSQAPVITCPTNITVSNDAGVCSATVTYTIPTATDNCVAPLPTIPGYTYYSTVGNTAYYTSNSTILASSQNAEQVFASGQGANLLSIDDAAENALMVSIQGALGAIVIPLNDVAVEGTFVWANGNPVVYTNWQPGEPNNGGGVEDYTQLVSGPDQWNDRDDFLGIYVLEYSIPQTAVAQTDVTGLTSGDAFPVGTTTLEYTATDDSGNTSVCTFDVTVNDTENPTITCATPAVNYNTNTACTYVHSGPALDPTAFADNCPGATVSNNFNASASLDGATFPLGTTTVIWTATDASSNTITCQYDVVVVDTEVPTITCATPAASYDADGGVCTYTYSGTGLDPTATADNCSVASVLNDFTGTATLDAAVFPEGTTSVVWTVTDGSGNIATCTYDIIVVDVEDPVITCPGNVTVSNDPGVCGATVTYANPTATDNCGGGIPNILFVSDVAAGTEIATSLTGQGYTVTSVLNDFVAGNNATLQGSLVGYDAIYWHAVGGGFGDAHNLATFTNLNSFVAGGGAVFVTGYDVIASPIDPNLITFLGGTGSVDVPPGGGLGTIVGPSNSLNDGFANIIGLTLANGVDHDALTGLLGGCTTVAPNGSGADWAIYNTGGGDVAWVSSGQNIGAFPAWTTPGSGYYEAVLNFAFNASGSGASITQTDATGLASGDVFPIGTTTLEYTATDNSGNTDVCTFTVTVNDTELPTITCATPAASYNSDANVCTYTQPDTGLDPTASGDNCSVASVLNNFNNTATLNGATFPLGSTTVVWTVTDDSGNIATCSYAVVIVDNQAPTAICQNITVPLGAGGTVSIVPGQVNNGSFDNCSIAGLGVLPNNFTCGNLGANTVTLTVLDNSGNSSTCTSTVTVVDMIPPTAVCQDITVQLNAAGNATVTGAAINNGSTDNCSITTLTANPNAFTCADAGSVVPVTLTVTDQSGNSSSCISNVTVQDNIAPTAVCQDITVTLDATGNVSIVAGDIDGGSTDNCGAPSLSASTTTFDCSMTGPNTVTLTVTDASGNVSTCNATVTVQDTEDPVITCPGDVTVSNDPGVCGATVTYAAPSATDNCAGVAAGSVTFNFTGAMQTFTVPAGVTEITVDAWGAEGGSALNNSSWDPTFQMGGNGGYSGGILSVIPGQTLHVYVGQKGGPGNTGGFNGGGQGGSDQNTTSSGGGASDLRILPGTLSDRVLVAAGGGGAEWAGAGNQAGQGGGLTGGVNGGGDDPASSGGPGTQFAGGSVAAIDPCAGSFGPSFPGTFGFGGNAMNGHSGGGGGGYFGGAAGTCNGHGGGGSSYIGGVASGTTTPGVQLGNGLVTISWSGTSGMTIAQTDLTGLTSGDVFPVGTTTLEYTATDDSGNTDVCTFNVIVTDDEAPVAVCQNITVQLNASGSASIVAADVDGGSTDNCAITTTSINTSAFTCANVGPNNVTLTVEDAAGNSSTCVAVVTIEDNVAPTVTCNNFTVALDAAGNATITTNDIGGATAADACGIASVTASQTAFTCANVGNNPVTLTVTDNNGNVTTCVANVTVQDNTAPTAVCAAGPVVFALDASGNVTITGLSVDGGSTDACGIASYAVFPNTFTCANIGINNVTLTVTDVNGNSSTCNTTVDIQDQTAPVINCPSNISVTSVNNFCGRTVSYNFNYTDACATVSQTDGTGFTSGSLFPVGTTIQTYEVTDQTGTYTCSFTVTVTDNQNPIITNCPSNITVSNDAGRCDARVLWTEPIASDNCPAVSFTSTHSPGDVFPLGTTVVTYTATDASGNSVTCTFNVTVNDNESPVITACTPDVTVSNDPAICGAIVTFAPPTYTENCTMGTEVASQASGTMFPVGTTTVTWTLTDNAGNISTCSFDVTVEDTEAPVANCTNITIQLDGTGNVTIVPGDINGGSTDNCGIASITASQTAFDCSNVGPNTVVLTVEDIYGNTSTCNAIVTVEDNVAPVAVCSPFTVQLDASGNATITGNDIDGGSTDNCGIATLVATPNSFTCANVGGNVVMLTVEDDNGNVSTCNTTVTVQDNIAPTAVCQNITVQLDAAGSYTMTASEINNGSSDNCSVASISASQTVFSCFDVGANTVTLTVTDVNGNSSTCNAIVTVQDNVAPVAICQDIIVQLDAAGNATITTGQIDNGSNDACGIASLALDVTTFDCSNVGANPVVLTVTDNNGNVSTCSSTVTVEDNVAPVAICQDITVQLDAAGNATITTGDIDNGSNDACGIASLVLDVTTFDCTNVGTNPVVLTVTDNNGNVTTCSSTVTVEDNIAPNAVCQDITIFLDAAGNYTMAPSEINGGSTDNCTIASITASQTVFTCADVTVGFIGTPVTLTVTDVNGNVSTCIAEVIVRDNIAPVAICQAATVFLDASGNGSITTGDIDNGSNDACGIASLALDNTTFDCSNVGPNTVTLTVTDNNGNVSTCTASVTVIDNVAPVAICQDVTVQLDASGNGSITAGDVDNGSNDACGIASLVLDNTSFTCANVGSNTVTLTVTDNNGNVSTCTSTITVEDNVAPVAICQNITVQLDGTGNVSITTGDIDNGSSDACGIASMSLDVTDFDCSNVGTNPVVLTVTDNNGNVSTCNAIVTVEDNVAPVAICQDITVQLDATGNASITTGDIDNGSNDACGIASMSLDVTDFDCSNVGTNPVVLTVTDNNGNVTTCSSTVTVQDNIAPVAICQDITVQLDATGNVSITTGDIDNGSNDACGIASLSLDITNFDCSDIGANTVVLTVTDNNGNVSTCSSTVTVEDIEAPIITCPSDVLVSNDPGLCVASSVAIGMATATDNCTAFVIITNDAPAVYPFGNTTVTWTATDGSGNSSTCTQTVTVEDVENPMITCPASVVVSTDANSCNATGVALGTPTTSDNCTVATVTNNAPAVYPLGVTNVTWTVTDVQGNTASCIQTVTVQDTEVPVITCPTDITVGTNPGVCAASGVALGSPTTSDNCTISSVTNNAPGVFPLGNTTVTWTVTDAAGNTATCNQIVTVVDNVNPTIACPADITVNSTAGICGATGVSLGSPITNDNCAVATVSNDAPATFPLGDTDVTWTVTDASGNTAECIQVVTVIDVQAPVITCPTNVVVTANTGSCNATGVALGSPVTSDNCVVATVTNNAPSSFPLGNTTVTWTVTDGAGNTATCTQLVTVTDNQAPVIVCPTNITVSANGGTCSATLVALGSPMVSDNCAMGTVTNNAPGTYPLGNTTVTWTATDAAGNVSTCTQIVTVIDTQAPAIACPGDVIVAANTGSCFATGVALGTAVTSDNCTVATVTNNAPAAFPLGMTTVTWTVTDAAGNTSTCTQMVTVNDTQLPMITCPADLIVSADANNCNATTVVLGTPVTSDNCSIASVTNDAPAIYALGTTTVTWTIVDGSGNSSTCMQTVTVEDYEAPTITCPSDVTYTADAGVCGSTVVVLGSPVTNDNCSVASTVNDAPAFFPVGNTTVTWTVTDGSGNTATCTQIVTVTDDELPVIASCASDITVNADPGSCNATGVTLTPPSATDNCSIASITNNAPATFPAGTTTVTWTVTDDSGNNTTCTQQVTVLDSEAPVITCPTNITANNTPGFCGSSVSYGTPVVSDNCGIASLTQTDGVGYTSGNLFPIGSTMQEYTVIDISGNTAVCSFTVTVIDAQMPTITGCPADMTIFTSEPNECEVKVDWTQPQATDNCPGTTIAQDYYSGESFPFGTTTVTYTATDNAGNVTTCSFDITVIDMVNPTVSFDTDGVTLVADNAGTSYQWIDCATGNPISGATGATYTPSSNGSYAVIINDNGCIDTSSCQTVSAVGIEDITFVDLAIYPNPSMTGVFKIKYSGEIKQVELFDMLGRVITLPVDLTEKVIDGTELASGKYMLRLFTDRGVTVKEVVISR